MGRIYVSDAIKPAIRIITDAYVKRLVTEEDIYRMAYGMAYHKEETETEEEKFPHTLSREEEKDKEERTHTLKKSKKSSFFPPSFLEVQTFGMEIGATEKQIQRFFNTYESVDWTTEKGIRITNWKSRLKLWIDDDARKKVPDTNTSVGRGEEEDWRALGAWLDANYLVSDETRAKAEEAVKRPEVSLATLGRLAGTDVVYRAVIKKLYRLGEALNTSRKGLKPEKLECIAKEIVRIGYEKTFEELEIFFTQCKHGHHGSFPKGLQMTDLLRAFGKYLRP